MKTTLSTPKALPALKLAVIFNSSSTLSVEAGRMPRSAAAGARNQVEGIRADHDVRQKLLYEEVRIKAEGR